MSDEDFIVELFCSVDEAMKYEKKHSQAHLHPSEVVTLAILFALKGVGNRAFYRWVKKNWKPLFPGLPHRTRLFRLFVTHFVTHEDWSNRFLAEPSLLGVADSYGVELIHPWREGRSERQIGVKGLSNHRWIVGGKLAFVLNHVGRVIGIGWDCSTANVHDSTFQPLVEQFADQSVILVDSNFKAKDDNPQSSQHEGVQARRMERPYAYRVGVVDADGRVSFQESRSSGVGLLSGTLGLHDGCVQRVGRLVWPSV